MPNTENIVVVSNGKFEVQELHTNGEWENTWTIENAAGEMIPHLFDSSKMAEKELEEHLNEMEREEMGADPDNYRVVPVGFVDRNVQHESAAEQANDIAARGPGWRYRKLKEVPAAGDFAINDASPRGVSQSPFSKMNFSDQVAHIISREKFKNDSRKTGLFYQLIVKQDGRSTDWFFDSEEEFKKAKEVAALEVYAATVTYEGTVQRLPANEFITDADELATSLENEDREADDQMVFIGRA